MNVHFSLFYENEPVSILLFAPTEWSAEFVHDLPVSFDVNTMKSVEFLHNNLKE